jgi:hypothetical protein
MCVWWRAFTTDCCRNLHKPAALLNQLLPCEPKYHGPTFDLLEVGLVIGTHPRTVWSPLSDSQSLVACCSAKLCRHQKALAHERTHTRTAAKVNQLGCPHPKFRWNLSLKTTNMPSYRLRFLTVPLEGVLLFFAHEKSPTTKDCTPLFCQGRRHCQFQPQWTGVVGKCGNERYSTVHGELRGTISSCTELAPYHTPLKRTIKMGHLRYTHQ